LIPGSQQILTSELSRQEYSKAKERMQAAIEWFRKECATLETRSSGRVTVALLDSVKVYLPETEGAPTRLEELATIGVRDGTTLMITVFQENVCFLLIL
jgi:ribosome recycling factor